MSPECARPLTGIAEEKDNATVTAAAPASTPQCPVCRGTFETCTCT